jgi:hypothetical protein
MLHSRTGRRAQAISLKNESNAFGAVIGGPSYLRINEWLAANGKEQEAARIEI